MGIWNQLNTKTIADNPGTEIQVQSNPVHLQEQNRQDLSDIKLINDATMRDGSPIPGTATVVNVQYSDNAYVTIKTPAKGEVFQILGMFLFTATGFTGANISILDNVTGNRCHIADVSSSGGDVFDQGWGGPVYIDENVSLQIYPNGTLSSTASVNTYLTRVR